MLKSFLKKSYQDLSRLFLTPVVYRMLYLLRPGDRLAARPIHMPLPYRFETNDRSFAAFNTSMLPMLPDEGADHFVATRISNGRFGRIHDWQSIRSVTGVGSCQLSSTTVAMIGELQLLEYAREVEDVRLFRWKGDVFASGNIRLGTDREPTYRPCLLSLEFENGGARVLSCVVFDTNNGLDNPWSSEKNWCPLIDVATESLYFARYFKPRVLYRYDSVTRSIAKVYVEEQTQSVTYRSPSAPIQVRHENSAYYVGIAHSRSEGARNYQYATTYQTRFIVLETTYPFRLVGMTSPIYFDCLPQGFIYPFQIIGCQDSESVLISANIHDSETLLFRVPIAEVFRRMSPNDGTA